MRLQCSNDVCCGLGNNLIRIIKKWWHSSTNHTGIMTTCLVFTWSLWPSTELLPWSLQIMCIMCLCFVWSMPCCFEAISAALLSAISACYFIWLCSSSVSYCVGHSSSTQARYGYLLLLHIVVVQHNLVKLSRCIYKVSHKTFTCCFSTWSMTRLPVRI